MRVMLMYPGIRSAPGRRTAPGPSLLSRVGSAAQLGEELGPVGQLLLDHGKVWFELTACAISADSCARAAPDRAWNGVHRGYRAHPQGQGPGPSVPP
jgi:hypothetical protein